MRNNAEVIEDIINPRNDNNGKVPSTLPPTIYTANDDDEKKRIEGNRQLYEKLKSDPDYRDVVFNPENGGLKASHKDHNFDKEGGVYELDVQSAGYNSGHSVVLESEKWENSKYTERKWDGMVCYLKLLAERLVQKIIY